MYKTIVLSKINEYCKKIKYPAKKTGSVIMMDCPYCEGEYSANVIPNTSIINCLKCTKKFNLFDLVGEFEGRDDNNDDICDYLIEFLEIDAQTKKEQDFIASIFDRYQKEGICLVPCAKKDKIPVQNNWTNIENRNVEEWHQWLNNGLNIGIRTGAVSNITVIDIDILSNKEKIELVNPDTPKDRVEELKQKKQIPADIIDIMGAPWIQETLGGFHLFYKYADLPKCRILREGYAIDLENDGGQVISAPSKEVCVKEEYKDAKDVTRKRIVGYGTRTFLKMETLPSIPDTMLELLKGSISKNSKNDDNQSLVEQANRPMNEVVKLALLDEGDGRNSFFTSLGGCFLKQMTVAQVEYALHNLNQRLCKTPLEAREIRGMVRGFDRYAAQDQGKLETEILQYIKLAEGASKIDIEIAVLGGKVKGEEKKKVDETIVTLIKDRKIVRRGRFYQAIKEMQWVDTFTEIGIPIDFKIPYFHDYANFNYGDLILIGATSKTGKTTLGMNIVKRLVDQKIKPYYIYSESGARFKNAALALGMKDGDFHKCYCDNIDEVVFKKERNVTVWDWIDPQDFARTNVIFADISKKLEEAQGICIAFVQLREGENGKEPEWFAKNMIRQRPALAAKYLYESEDGSIGKFKITDVRDSKVKGKTFDIPTKYDWDTKEVVRLDEDDPLEAS
ncbi:MAG TPA: hypothetical protein ENI61_04325 [Ignavibacteria bacterium]|nr:hypothetical protein [Ignavibacteria bacterium]